jgi:hypothetical protein
MGDEVGKAFHRHGIAVLNEVRDRFLKCGDIRHALRRL